MAGAFVICRPKGRQMHFRELRFVGAADQKTRSVPVTVSSDTAVDRGMYFEILDHSPGGVDLARAPLPLIESHDDSRLNIGIVEDLRVEGGKLRGTARFGESARAVEVFADIVARVVRGVSIGYELLDKGKPVPHPSGEARRFKFRPIEVSVVAVPADTTVGFYRSLRKPNMDTTFDSGAAGDTGSQSRSQRRAAVYGADEGVRQERERATGIMALATRHGLRELGERAVAEGTALEYFRGAALDEMHRRGSDRPLYQPVAEIGMSEAETRSFSVARLYRSLVDNNATVAPFERDCVRAVQARMERAGQAPQRGGMLLPYEVMRAPLPGLQMRGGHVMVGDRVVMHRDMASSSTSAGGAMVATDLLHGSFIEFLRAKTLVFALGATRLSGLVGNVAIPKQLGTTTMNWVAQSGLAPESDATFGVVTLSPKTAHGIQDVTRDLLIQGSPAVEGIVRADLLACLATTIDYAAIAGTGASNQPTGIINSVGLAAVLGGANGAAPTWDHMVQLEEAVANSNTDGGMLAYLSNPRVRSKLKRTQKFSGTNGDSVFERPFDGDDPASFGVINGYRAGITTHVPSNLTKGSASGICSAIIYGNFADVVIGEWSTAEILPDPLTQAANRIIRMHVYQSVDVALRRGQSFAMMNDALTT